MSSKIRMIGCLMMMSFMCVLSRSIIDPVSRHDSNQCAVYLCKEHSDLATEYLNSGCEGDFGDFIRKNKIKMMETQLEIVKDSSCNINESPIDFVSFMMLVSLSSCISLFIGMMFAMYENSHKEEEEEEEEQELVEK